MGDPIKDLHRDVDYMMQLQQRVDDGATRTRKFIDQITGWYYKLDTKRGWVVPFSLIAMLALSILLLVPASLIAGYGWYLVGCSRWPTLARRWERCLTVVWHLLYCLGLCMVTHLLFIYFGWEQLFQQLLGN